MNYLIETIGITKHFSKTTALKEINLQIKEGEIFCLLGPNGSGKTTLLKILATLILPTKGTAYINGFEIISQPMDVKASIGLVTGDERSFYWRLTGRENLKFYATLYNLRQGITKDRINYLLNLLKIESPDKRVGEYSAGMRQRLGIARGLLHNPSVLLMDEPTKSLDPGITHELWTFIKDCLGKKEKKAVIITTHNLYEAGQVCDRLGILRNGELISSGTIEELKTKAGLPLEAGIEDVYIKLDSSLRSE